MLFPVSLLALLSGTSSCEGENSLSLLMAMEKVQTVKDFAAVGVVTNECIFLGMVLLVSSEFCQYTLVDEVKSSKLT
jgi:hypothetical protein